MAAGLSFKARFLEEDDMKKIYRKPMLRRLGLLRRITRFSF